MSTKVQCSLLVNEWMNDDDTEDSRLRHHLTFRSPYFSLSICFWRIFGFFPHWFGRLTIIFLPKRVDIIQHEQSHQNNNTNNSDCFIFFFDISVRLHDCHRVQQTTDRRRDGRTYGREDIIKCMEHKHNSYKVFRLFIFSVPLNRHTMFGFIYYALVKNAS